MKRIRLHLTQDQDRRISGLAKYYSVSKAEIIRQILDRRLCSGQGEEEARNIIRSTAGLLSD